MASSIIAAQCCPIFKRKMIKINTHNKLCIILVEYILVTTIILLIHASNIDYKGKMIF